MTRTYEYIHANDVLDDDNNGLVFGIQDNDDFPGYIEWFRSMSQLITHTARHKMTVVNDEQFINIYGSKE